MNYLDVQIDYKDIIERLGQKKNVYQLKNHDKTIVQYENGYIALARKNQIVKQDYAMLDNCKDVFFNINY